MAPLALSIRRYRPRSRLPTCDSNTVLIYLPFFWSRTLNQVLTLYQTSLGKKYIMAITGLIGIGFVVMHMLGNMQVFLGREKLNHYAELLRAAGGLLWFARAVLL